MNREKMISRLSAYLSRVKELGGYTRELIVKEPATEAEISAVEAQLGYKIPEDFRNVLLHISSHLEIFWNLSGDDGKDIFTLPEPLKEVFSGNLHWGLQFLIGFEESRKDWVETCFPNYEDDYDRVWHNKLVFAEVGNGDQLAIDLEPDNYGKVVYLSHDGSELNGYIFGNSFTEFVENSTILGGVGNEDWEMEVFTNELTTPLDANCPNAKLWFKTMGIEPIL